MSGLTLLPGKSRRWQFRVVPVHPVLDQPSADLRGEAGACGDYRRVLFDNKFGLPHVADLLHIRLGDSDSPERA
jgi:hypothetical protein